MSFKFSKIGIILFRRFNTSIHRSVLSDIENPLTELLPFHVAKRLFGEVSLYKRWPNGGVVEFHRFKDNAGCFYR